MKASELMQPNPEVVIPEDRLSEALRVMLTRNVGCVPVVDSRATLAPLGVITDRDAALYLASHDVRPSEVLCRSLMSSPVVTVAEEDDVKMAKDKMREFQLRRIIVVDGGRIAGIISQADFAREKPKDAQHILEDVSQPKAA